ncbi:MAG: class I SAM-dependent methyltransferase [Spirochaetaceae bacterium]|jgi:23S rRNA G2069 N7-methylase RlmK/C1962 C5-methylase RlmI|nr:class I SAM-dependent methyltransferase [Spirochaetaceae bacterium]
MTEDSAGSKTASQGEMLFNRLCKRERHLKKWAKRTGVEAFRLYDRDIPEIPLVLDRYGDAVSGALYKRPYQKDDAEEERWLSAMQEAIAGALGIPPSRIFLKQRRQQRGNAQYTKMGEIHFTRDVREGGLLFRVNLSDYLDTGLFPDRRRMRILAGREGSGMRVLNLFCYTAAFSVHAAAGGAAEVDSLDISNTYLDWGALNFSLNGFRAKRVDPRALLEGSGGTGGGKLPPLRLIRADALGFIDAARRARRSWNLIILDPPAFSNSKKMSGTLDLKRDHRELISRTLDLLCPGGKLWFSANPRQFRLDRADFPGVTIEDMGPLIIDEDFRGRKLPPCFTFQV